jgi:hypothetical protein
LAPTIPTTEPTTLAANASAVWHRSSADYPATDGWTLRYYFRGVAKFDIAAVADGAGYVATIAPADTADCDAGTYRWSSFFEKGAGVSLQRWPDRTGVLELTADFSATANGEEQPLAEQMVAAIETRLGKRVGADIESYGLAGQTAMKIPFAELMRELGLWKARLWRVQNPRAMAPIIRTVNRASR